jgi:hypothetical protein
MATSFTEGMCNRLSKASKMPVRFVIMADITLTEVNTPRIAYRLLLTESI